MNVLGCDKRRYQSSYPRRTRLEAKKDVSRQKRRKNYGITQPLTLVEQEGLNVRLVLYSKCILRIILSSNYILRKTGSISLTSTTNFLMSSFGSTASRLIAVNISVNPRLLTKFTAVVFTLVPVPCSESSSEKGNSILLTTSTLLIFVVKSGSSFNPSITPHSNVTTMSKISSPPISLVHSAIPKILS